MYSCARLCAPTPMGPPGVCAHMCVRSMNAPPDYYSLEPDVPLIGGRGWSVEEERQPNNEVRCIRVAPFHCCFTQSTVQFATLWVSSFCNSAVPLISLPDLSVFSVFCFPPYSLCLYLLLLSVCATPPSLLLMWRQMLRAPRRRVSLI